MAQSIPISQIVTVNPSVVGAGGNPLSLNAVFADQSPIVPLSSMLSFSSRDSVADYFGSNAQQTILAGKYFNGFDNSSRKPGTLFFAGYADDDTPAWLRGSSLAGTTLDQLQGISGTLSIKIDGTTYSTAALNLSAATSFSNAASMIATDLALGSNASCTWDATSSRFVIETVSVGAASTITQATGTAAAPLGLSAGILSKGFDADTPSSFMDRIKDQELNWASFMTTWEPDLADKTEFAAWINDQNAEYLYVCSDSDAGYETTNNPGVFGSIVDINNYEGTLVIYGTSEYAAFVCGIAGSVNFQETNGRTTAAFRSQGGLEPYVRSIEVANAVLSNNASYYGLYAARGENNIYSIMYDGRMRGSRFLWFDTYINQIYLNSQARLAVFNGLKQEKSTDYGARGQTLIRAWLADPIAEALNNGTIRTGIQLSEAQKASIASAAGLDISTQLQTAGYYVQILQASAQVRQQRKSPPIKIWYTDGGSIHSIEIASIAVL